MVEAVVYLLIRDCSDYENCPEIEGIWARAEACQAAIWDLAFEQMAASPNWNWYAEQDTDSQGDWRLRLWPTYGDREEPYSCGVSDYVAQKMALK